MKNINDICIVVQARLGSQRVPGKMLRPFAETTLVDILFEKLKSSKVIPLDNIYFSAYHNEGGSYTSLAYRSGVDLAQSTNFIELGDEIGNENDQCFAATLHLFDPSNTTFVKHYLYRGSHTQGNGDYMVDIFSAGYFNTTSALDAIQFKFSSGNIDAGTIKLYGVS